MESKEDLRKAYANRFLENEWKQRDQMWRILCREFFDKWIKHGDDVLDIAAGYCDFINNVATKPDGVRGGRRIAVDLNPDVAKHARRNVETHNAKAQKLDFLGDASVDVVFMSNFLEHIRRKEDILEIIRESKRVLRNGKKLLILQPNIKYAGGKYWDFFDHVTPLTEKSLEEALDIVGGFRVDTLIPRFLPYTTKSRIPKANWMIYLYCKCPFAWKVMGEQTFLAATKVEGDDE